MDIVDKYIGEAKSESDKKYKKEVLDKFKAVKKRLADAEKFFKQEQLKDAQMQLGGLTNDIKDLWKSI
jgi:hypothetical protein